MLLARHFTPDHDALARGEGEVAAGAARLAVAALDALVDLGLDGGQLLQVVQMRVRVGVDDDAGIEQASGIGQRLELTHDLVGIGAPLGFDEGSHVAPGSMLGLERSIEAVDDQFHDIVDEARVLVDGALIIERLGNDEVEIAVLGVAEDDGIVIIVAAEEPVQFLRGGREVLDGEGDVFDDDRGAAVADRADGGKHSGANLPERGLGRRGVSELRGLKQFEARGRVGGQGFELRTLGLQRRTGTRPAIRLRLRRES